MARLEQDRQETQASLDQQEVKSRDLKDDMEREDERRHVLLLKSVQAGGCGYTEAG